MADTLALSLEHREHSPDEHPDYRATHRPDYGVVHQMLPELRAQAFETAPNPIKLLDAGGHVLSANLAALRWLDVPKAAVLGRAAADFVAPDQRTALAEAIAAAAAGRSATLELHLHESGDTSDAWEATLYPLDPARPGTVVMVCRDIATARRRDIELSGQARILRAIAEGAPLQRVLDDCCLLAEALAEGSRCCVLVPDAAMMPPPPPDAPTPAQHDDPPALPANFVAGLHTLKLVEDGPDGTAEMAVFRVMVAADRQGGPALAECTPAAQTDAVTACWALPLRVGGRALGSFATYYRTPRAPSDAELAAIWRCAKLAALAVGAQQARQAQQDSEARFSVAAEAVPGFLWVADAAGNLTHVNEFYQQRTGRSARELIEGAWLDTLHPDDREAGAATWEAAIASGTRVECRYRVRMADGTYRWHLERGLPQRAADGSVTAWVGVAMDIEELVAGREAIQSYRAELETLVAERTQALRQTTQDLQEEMARREQAMAALANTHRIEALGQLTAGVAHDFNNLLSAIMGGFQLIESQTTDPALLKLTRNGLHASERAASLVRQLLAVARQDPPRAEWLDLSVALPGMQDLLRHALHPRITLSVQVPRDIWPVFVDLPQLETALLNLSVNARDAMPERGSLTISAANDPAAPGQATAPDHATATGQPEARDHVVIDIADTGVGIPPHLIDRICEPFFTTKPRGEGTGLGLAMVKNFVEAAGGTIRIDSREGAGTRISLRLPRAPAPTAAPAPETTPGQAAEPDPSVTPTALVVDDDEAVRAITAAFLRAAGYQVREAGNGVVALALLQVSGPTDILVTDLMMPGMDGLQLAHAVRAARPGMPVVLLTGFADQHDLAGEIVVRKPYAAAELVAAVSRALGRPPEQAPAADLLLGSMRSDLIREAYMTWQALRGDEALPRFGSLTVAGRAWSENAFLLAVDGAADTAGFRWLSVGQALAGRLSPAAEGLASTVLGPLDRIYRECVANAQPHYQNGPHGELLLLPVTSEAGGVTHVLGIIAVDAAEPAPEFK